MRHVEKFTGKPRDRRYFDTMIGFFQEKLRNIIFARDILHIVIIEDGKKNIFKKGNWGNEEEFSWKKISIRLFFLFVYI